MMETCLMYGSHTSAACVHERMNTLDQWVTSMNKCCSLLLLRWPVLKQILQSFPKGSWGRESQLPSGGPIGEYFFFFFCTVLKPFPGSLSPASIPVPWNHFLKQTTCTQSLAPALLSGGPQTKAVNFARVPRKQNFRMRYGLGSLPG